MIQNVSMYTSEPSHDILCLKMRPILPKAFCRLGMDTLLANGINGKTETKELRNYKNILITKFIRAISKF